MRRPSRFETSVIAGRPIDNPINLRLSRFFRPSGLNSKSARNRYYCNHEAIGGLSSSSLGHEPAHALLVFWLSGASRVRRGSLRAVRRSLSDAFVCFRHPPSVRETCDRCDGSSGRLRSKHFLREDRSSVPGWRILVPPLASDLGGSASAARLVFHCPRARMRLRDRAPHGLHVGDGELSCSGVAFHPHGFDPAADWLSVPSIFSALFKPQ